MTLQDYTRRAAEDRGETFRDGLSAVTVLARSGVLPRVEPFAGLGLYLVPRVLEDGTPNHYSVRRLKEKLGTKSVPTGEVEFLSTVAREISEPQRLEAREARRDLREDHGVQDQRAAECHVESDDKRENVRHEGRASLTRWPCARRTRPKKSQQVAK